MSMSVRDFLDLEAVLSREEEEEEEEEETLSDILDDDEISSDGLDDISRVGESSAVQDLEEDVRRIVARRTGPVTVPMIEDLALPFRVPRDTDPSIWSVKVKPGRELDVVLQICRRCIESSKSQVPAVTSAFARSSIPGHVFVEAFDVGEVCRAVDGLCVVRDKQPHFIAPTEYVTLLSWDTLPRVEVGQWVRCLIGRYRHDLGYVSATDEWNATVVFVPRIPGPRGKRQSDGRPPPRAWTATEVAQQYGHRRIQVQGPNKFVFGGSTYEDGLVMVRVPMSHLRVSNHSPGDIAPFVRSATLRTDPLFDACVKRFAQDSTQVGDRILVVSGEQAGMIGRVERIHDNVAGVVTQGKEEHSGLAIDIVLHDLVPHFLVGDHVKDRWSDSVGIVVAVDNNVEKLTFLNKATNEEIITSTLGVQFYNPPSRFFRLTPGLFVEFLGAAGVTRRGRVIQVLDGNVKVMDERDGNVVHTVNEDEISVSGVQAPMLPRSKPNDVWENKRVVIKSGAFKGYHGLVKAQWEDGVDVDLDAKLASFGSGRQRFSFDQLIIECRVEHTWMPATPAVSSSRLTPPPEGMARSLTPEPEEPELTRRKHWLFAEALQEALGDECIPFHIQGVPALSSHGKYEGLSAKTVAVAKRKISPEPNEVVMSVVQKGRPKQISIHPCFLVPWALVEGNKVIIVEDHRIGQVGKLVKLDDGCCAVELASSSSGELSYFKEAEVVNVLEK